MFVECAAVYRSFCLTSHLSMLQLNFVLPAKVHLTPVDCKAVIVQDRLVNPARPYVWAPAPVRYIPAHTVAVSRVTPSLQQTHLLLWQPETSQEGPAVVLVMNMCCWDVRPIHHAICIAYYRMQQILDLLWSVNITEALWGAFLTSLSTPQPSQLPKFHIRDHTE